LVLEFGTIFAIGSDSDYYYFPCIKVKFLNKYFNSLNINYTLVGVGVGEGIGVGVGVDEGVGVG
jgi:hypothetical protein